MDHHQKPDDLGLQTYDRGATPFYALRSDTRVSYCLYVPKGYDAEGQTRYPLITLMHGTERGAARYRDMARAFAEEHQVIILAPLFPCNLFYIGDTENYKLLRFGDLRFDLALLSMVDEVAARYRLLSKQFLLHGFSGGGHFTHRFLYAHPQRLRGASIGAPGVVTLLDPSKPYPLGLQGMDTYLGAEICPDSVPDVPIQCVVGANDTETWEITVSEKSPHYVPGINDTGITRIDRLRTLAASLEAAGAKVRFDLVPGAVHDAEQVIAPVLDFFAAELEKWRAE